MLRKISLLLIIALAVIKIHAQGIISGMVMDKNAKSLPGATLKLDKYNRYTVSDANGHYEFLNVPEGSYQVKVTYLGYASQSKPATVVAKKNSVVKFSLEDGSVEGKEVIIQGEMLRGQAQALNQQKTNSRITNVISADQVGRFPDANIGDALKRVTGITMQNDQGEARNIIIRGLAPELNSVTLNGNRIPSAEGDNRNVQMDLIPSDMISNIEVSKTLSADMDADAIGGSVELTTRATPNKQRISVSVSGGYVPIRDKAMYSASLVYGNRFFNNKLGVILSGSVQNKDYGSDNIEGVWSQDKNESAYVSQFDIRKYYVQRIRRSLSGAFDYKFDANNSIAADLIYNWRWDRENRYRVRYKKVTPEYDDNNDVTGYTGEIQREVKGGINNNKNKNHRLEDQRIQSYALRGKHLVSHSLNLDWNLSFSKASEERPNERYITFNQKKLDMTEDLSDERHPYLNAASEDMDKMKFKDLTENHNYTDEKEYAFKVNARMPLSLINDQKGRIRFGVRGRFKDKERDNNYYSYEPVDGIGVLSSMSSTKYISGKGFNAGSKYVPGLFVTNTYLGSLNLKNSSEFTEVDDPSEYLSQNYTAKEQVLAGYVRWDQNLNNKTLLILGLRSENTHIDYTGNKVIIDEDGNVTCTPQSETNSYINFFPSAILKYNVSDDLVLRGAFTTSLARPNYYNLVPYTSIVQDDEAVSVGNPDLKATYAYNFDVMGEYYFKTVGIVSAGLFYKNLKHFIYEYKNLTYTASNFSSDFPTLTNPMESGDEWTYSQYRNGKEVNVFGFEVGFQRKLDFLPSQFLRNFNLYLNYTYTKSKTKGIWDSDGNERTNVSLPGTAPHMFNGSLAWENKRFSARASLNYTSGYIDALGGDAFQDSYYDKQMFLDMNASYKFKSKWRLFAEANNLTNQPLRYYQGSKERIQQLEYYKPTYNIGLKYDF